MRGSWLPLGLVLLAGVAPLACGQEFQLTGSAGSSTGAGGSSVASAGSTGGGAVSSGGGGATTSTTTSTGGSTCMTAADCTGPTSLCGEVACQAGTCGLHGLQPDGPSFSQLYGDCHVATCSEAQLTNVEKTGDIYDDGNPCTKDFCDNGMPSNVIEMGNACGISGVCSAKGTCVECLTTGTCPGEKPVCINGYCSASTCQNGGVIADGTETDVDCGGDACGPCDAGLICKLPSDCKSKVCEDAFMGALFKQCQIATCMDAVQNGTETDIDCGGMGCPTTSKCIDTKHCAAPGDCMSGVCQAGTCQAASCGDGVKNGTETGVDCGGGAAGCAPKCPTN